MSFPYTTTSPPPTSGALTVVDKANVSQAYAGGGGGGGGGSSSQISSVGAYVICSTNGVLYMGNTGVGTSDIQIGDTNTTGINLQNANNDSLTLYSGSIAFQTTNVNMSATNLNVSSINGAPPGTASIPADLSVSTLTVSSIMNAPNGLTFNGPGMLFQNASTPANNDINIQTLVPGASIYPTFTGDGGVVAVSAPAGNNALAVGATNGDGGFIVNTVAAGATVSTLKVISAGDIEVTAPLTTISSLNVSSINGAAPGNATIPADLSVSSITFSTSGILQMSGSIGFKDPTTAATNDGELFMGLPATGLNANLGTSLVNGITFISPSALGTNAAFAASDALGMLIVSADSVNGNLSSMSLLADNVNISSLRVSSINGAAPGGGGGGMMFSSIAIPGGAGSAFNSDPNVLNQIVTFPIIPNHVYNVNVDCRVQANAPTVTDTDNVYIELLPNGGTTQAMDTAWGVQVSTLTSGSIYTQVGGSALFKAPVNAVSTCSLGVLGSFSTTVRVDSVTYVDMGDI